ncbi:MAG: NAD(P)H-quinone oxidoreductase [Acidobacteriales bacterium]|nr:NAD(P)H-quinone oxidoreductase [Terriglobales bacterium]
MMRAIVISRPGGPEVLEMREVPVPRAGPNELLVSVKATAVNRLDLLQRMGMYPPPPDCPQDIPGVEYAGEVASIGPNVSLFQPGDRVFGLVGGGSYAEYLVVHERTVMPIPEGMSFDAAAAVPEAFITAYDAMILQARLKAGETVLISAVGSGVGAAAVQLAKAFGACAVGTARSARKIAAANELGLDNGIVVTDGNFVDKVLEATEGRGVDVVLELAGGSYVTDDIRLMAPRARLVVIGLVAGARAEIDLARLLRNRLQIRGTVLRARSLEEKITVIEQFAADVLPLLGSGKVKPIIDRVLYLSAAAEAHECVAANENFGKVVLAVENS